MDDDREELEEDEFKRGGEDDLDILPPEGMEDDFGLDDPDDRYH